MSPVGHEHRRVVRKTEDVNGKLHARRGASFLAACISLVLILAGAIGVPSAAMGAPQQTERQVLKCYTEGVALFCEQDQLQQLITEAGTTPTRIEIGNGIETLLTKTVVIPKGADIELVGADVAPWGGGSKIVRDDGTFTGSLIRVEKGGKLTLSAGTGDGEGLVIDSRAQYDNVVKGDTFAPTVYVRGELVMNAGSIEGARKISGTGEGAVTIDGPEAKFTLNGGTITDNQRKNEPSTTQHGAANVALNNGATMVMNGGEISKGYAAEQADAYGEAGGVGVFKGSHLELNGGKITGNKGWAGNINVTNWLWDCPKPGEDTSKSRSTLVINNGEISNGYAAFGGGGINVFGNAQVTMNGGSITGNTAPNGGGINAMDLYAWGASGTWAEVPGDGMSCKFKPEEWSKVSPGGFTMNGGSITENKAYRTGGGVNSVSNAVELNAGLIEGNVAEQQGGGVYVASDSFSAHFKDTLITKNSAMSGSYLAYGGGIWLCPTGDLETYVTNGVAIFDNEAPKGSRSSHWGDDIAHDSYGSSSGARIQMDSRMLGGGETTYYRDGASAAPARFDANNPGKEQVFDGTERASDETHDYKTKLRNEGLKTVADTSAKDRAKSWARLTIQKNHAPRGAGVGSNGTLVFGTPEKTEVKVTKAWKTADGKDLDAKSTVPVKVQLVGSVDGEKFDVGNPVELNAQNAWTHTFTDLPTTKTVDGKQAKIGYSVEELTVEGFTSAVTGDAASGFTITNTQTPPPTTEVSVNKVWKSFDGKDLDPALTIPVKVQLMKTVDGKTSPVGEPVELNSENDWTHTFTDLPEWQLVDGKKASISYSVEELAVDGFTSAVTGDAASGFTITNTQTPPPTTEVAVNKVWKDAEGNALDADSTMPVKVQLMKTVDGKTTPVGDPVELNAGNNWAHTFADLPASEKIDGALLDVTYSVEEVAVEGFASEVTGDAASGFTVTNTQIPPVSEVPVEKVWKAADGSVLDPALTMPVKVQLMESTGGKKSPVGDPVELNAGNNWTHTFTGLPLTKKIDGKQVDIAYSVEELEVDGYTSIVTGNARDGFTITNTQTPPTPPTTEVSVNKVWKSFDGKDLDPALTMPVKVQLMESTGGEKSPVGDPVELNSENGWKHTFTGLPLTKSIDGKQVDIAYSVEELEVDGLSLIHI